MQKRVNLVVSNTYLSSFDLVLDKIQASINDNKFNNIILVVPDKFSMNAEQLFFERLKTKSVFNVWLTTLSRLIKKVLGTKEQSYKVLTKQSGTMLVEKIILQRTEELSTYKKVAKNYSFAEKMYNVINLLKSSGIKPEELKNNIDNTNLGKKIKDIYIIYSAYENLLQGEMIDTITRMQLFSDVAKSSDYLKNSDIYFAMFDSFTNAQLSMLTKLAKTCKSLTFGVCYNVVQPNKQIYDNIVFQRLKENFESASLQVNIEFSKPKQEPLQKFITQNLFGIKSDKTFDTNKVKILECDNIEEEIRYVASSIKHKVMEQSLMFDDINVAINGLDTYMPIVQKVFDEYDFPYYLDVSRSLTTHYFVKLILKIFDFVSEKNSIIDAITIAQSPIFDVDANKLATFENFCNEYNIIGEEFFVPFNHIQTEACQIAEEVRKAVFENIKTFKTKLNEISTFADFVNILTEFLQSIDAQNKIKLISQNQIDVIEKRIDEQVYEKFYSVLTEVESVFDTQNITAQFAFEVVASGLGAINLSTVPLKCNSIFVGDASASTYIPKKELYVLGATESRMPAYSIDAGTLTDIEINNFKSKNLISPTIKELNRREKFKLFNLITNFKNSLSMSYSLVTNGEIQKPSEFITKLCEILICNGNKLSKQTYSQFVKLAFDSKLNDKYPNYIVGTTQNAIMLAKNIQNKNKKIKAGTQLQNIIDLQEKKYLFSKDSFNITNSKEVFFPHNHTKVSQIEKYFDCPFKHFLEYGIRPKEHKKFEIKSVDIGNILHEVAERFVNKCIKNNFDNIDVKQTTEQIFDNIINSNKYKNLLGKTFAIKKLREEAVRFCLAIDNQIKSSDFKPEKTEFKFENYQLDNGLTIKGLVDRYDVCGNSFRVIDYKTGKDKFSYASVYYGLKLQLILYLNILEDLLQKQGVGSFYMPVKNNMTTFAESEFSRYKFDGVVQNDKSILLKMDKSMLENSKSQIINVAFTKQGELSKQQSNFAITLQEFKNIKTYCTKILSNALDEMLSGYIMPKPYKKTDGKNSCDYCKHKAVCRYRMLDEGYREILSAIDKNKFGEN